MDELLGDAVAQQDGLGVPDMEVAVRLGGKTRAHPAVVVAGFHVGLDHGADEIQVFAFFFGRCFQIGVVVHHVVRPFRGITP